LGVGNLIYILTSKKNYKTLISFKINISLTICFSLFKMLTIWLPSNPLSEGDNLWAGGLGYAIFFSWNSVLVSFRFSLWEDWCRRLWWTLKMNYLYSNWVWKRVYSRGSRGFSYFLRDDLEMTGRILVIWG
jgi:hypothetical protein